MNSREGRTLTGARRGMNIVALSLMFVSLAGCASIRGSQVRVTTSDLKGFVAVCPSEDQVIAPHAGESDGAYRDRIIMVCVKAMNAKYADFTDALSKESTTVNLVTDVASQGLATAASVVTKAGLARKLAAGSALSLGINGAINKDLFYKQALPAIIASMDAKRSKVLTGIVRSQNIDRNAKTYTLARAGTDLDRYQDAGSLTTAVRELTSSAVENAAQADAVLQAAERNLDIGTYTTATSLDIKTRAILAADFVRTLETANRDVDLWAIAAALKQPQAAGAKANITGPIVRAEIAKVTTLTLDKQEARMKEIETALEPYRAAS